MPSRSARFALAWFVACLHVGCASNSNIGAYRAADFRASQVKTFAWDPAGNIMLGVVPEHRRVLDTAATEAVDAGLASHGWTNAPADVADVWVRYAVGAHDRYEVTKTGTLRIADRETVVPVEQKHLREGELAIDLLTPGTREVLWRGIGKGSREGVLSPDEVDQSVRRGVRGVLDQLSE